MTTPHLAAPHCHRQATFTPLTCLSSDPLRQRLALLQLQNSKETLYIHWSRSTSKGTSSTSTHLVTIVCPDFILLTSSACPALLHQSTMASVLTYLSLTSERKIDQIEARLGSIEGLLKNLSSASISGDTTRPITTPQTGSSAPTCESNEIDSSDQESAFGGDSGLTAQTAFASEFLERAVKRTSLRSVNPKMEAALANLGQLVDMQQSRSIVHRPRFPLQRPIPPGGVTKLPLPPMALVVDLLKKNKGNLSLKPHQRKWPNMW